MTSNASERKKLYDSRWRKARIKFLNDNPLCVYCLEHDKITAATVVDHIKPHRGDKALFWDEKNWQPLCKPCHDSTKQAEEHQGVRRGACSDGLPIDKKHHWNQ